LRSPVVAPQRVDAEMADGSPFALIDGPWGTSFPSGAADVGPYRRVHQVGRLWAILLAATRAEAGVPSKRDGGAEV